MMTSGLVVTLDPTSPAVQSALAALRASPAITVGDRRECWLSVVLEAQDRGECEYWDDWVRRLPGVEAVEVVFVHWDEAEAGVSHVGA